MSQPTPQPPQLIKVFRGVSHPSAGLLLQSSHPERQLPIPHTPVLQLGTAWSGLHSMPQAPQFNGVLVLVSQPSFAVVGLQSANPSTQVGTHCPFEQACPWVFASEQAAAHCPQLLTELSRSTSQPFACTPSQLPHPGLHSTTWHVCAVHAQVFTFGPLHLRPHDPQLSTFVMSVSQVAALESQSARPAGQMSGRQIPAAQVGVAGAVTSHIVPHPPQL
jgi:hypothetical protein